MDRKRASIVVFAVFIAAGLALPYLLPRHKGPSNGNVTLVVTRDFGRAILGTWEMRPGGTVMEMLRNVTEVETRYGGMFLYGMFGLKSSASNRSDWLYYVNGVFMDVGLSSYRPRPGEVVQIDYHHWGSYSGSPAFLSGYPAIATVGLKGRTRNTTIVSSPALLSLARRLARRLQAAGSPKPSVIGDGSVDPNLLSGNLIVLETTDDPPLCKEIMGWERGLLYPSVLRGEQIWLNGAGRGGEVLTQGCTAQCLYFPRRDLWTMIILGTDTEWVERGLKQVGTNRTRFLAAFALSPSGIIDLPLV